MPTSTHRKDLDHLFLVLRLGEIELLDGQSVGGLRNLGLLLGLLLRSVELVEVSDLCLKPPQMRYVTFDSFVVCIDGSDCALSYVASASSAAFLQE